MTSRFVSGLQMLTKAIVGSTDSPMARPTIGLALGSGGANGLAHIAILQVFDELGIVPDRIVGTSIGAVIGGLYAAGLSAKKIQGIFEMVAGSPLEALSGLAKSNVKLADLVRFGRSGGLLDSGGFMRLLATHTEARTFEELPIPLTVVATDYWTADSVSIDAGDLFPAIEASIAVPGLFMAVQRGEHLLIDGGTSNPLPFDLLQGTVDLVIAVDVSGNHQTNNGQDIGLSDMLFNSFKIMQQAITRQALHHQPPDILLRPQAPDVRLLHFHRINEILTHAEPVAAMLRDQLEDWLANWYSDSACLGRPTQL
ncbi:MAG: patatin-like phospholipase family protein [Pseudomonas sp.]|nr:patatin-like phospholipase family protein [Pseudomonas sp.]MDD2224117.1 patatin-like phospholipase family protein [Pseudomonas sp.]MDY0413331.1 patatin-like phospholipase family protein [Pseudomonas sp.]NLO54644.1 patatin-like phospholipase family protein [Gammaproteobacteria bacterium]